MLTGALGAVVGALAAGVLAWALAVRGERHAEDARDLRDVWGAIDGLRHEQADASEHLAELRGLVAGLYRFHGEAVPPAPRTPTPKRRVRE